MYNPSRINKLGFIDQLHIFLEDNYSPSLPVILCGNFKIDISKINQLSEKYLRRTFSNGYEKGDTKATRVTETTNNCLDHFINTNLTQTDHQVLEYKSFTNHYPILLQWNRSSLHKNVRNQSFVTYNLLKNKQSSAMYISDFQSQLKENEVPICYNSDPSPSFNNFAAVFIKITAYYATCE